VATETDAARVRVLAARAALGEELETLEASVRDAVDVPAKIRRSPAKAAAVVGGIGFVALRGPQRLFGVGKRAVRGAPPPLPASMLPDEIERSLRKLGDDGDKVRGALERDFAAYASQAKNRRQALRTLLLVSVARPLLGRGARATADWLFRTDEVGFQGRLDQIRERTSHLDRPSGGSDEPVADAAPAAPTDEEAGAAGA